MKRASILLVLSAMLIASVGATAAAQAPTGGFRALSGAEAANFVVPADMRLVRSLALADGLTYERYQQYFGDAQAEVLGAQITLYRNASGTIVSVIGSHYPDITPTNAVKLSKGDAESVAHRDVGAGDHRPIDLLIDPITGAYFYRVKTRGFASRWFHWIDADKGEVLNKYDAIQTDHGSGVKGDTKDINGPDNSNTADDLTTKSGNRWTLTSKDNRQRTFDARNGTTTAFNVTDKDNHWTTTGRTSPGHPALIDAQFYANVTDDYYLGRHSFNWLSCETQMRSVAHYSVNYNNAFWNGTYTIYGDGDGVVFRELSGGLDVVAHEHTHGVTDCTSQLIYQSESGALNESFSDMLGNSAEFFANEPTTTNCVRASGQTTCADWWIGEDVYLPADAVVGFRNMADPAEDGDPDHYSERLYPGPCTPSDTNDNCGVHSNSGIPNHAYYLLVNGGSNAGEARGHSHSGPVVTAISLADAERIFFLGFTGLPANVTMCNARVATVAQANSLFGSGSQQSQSTQNAWEAVGVTASLCGS